MNDKKEEKNKEECKEWRKRGLYGPVEQVINSLMETAGDEISDLTQKEPDIFVKEIVQNIRILNLNRCILYLAKEIDKLAKSIK